MRKEALERRPGTPGELSTGAPSCGPDTPLLSYWFTSSGSALVLGLTMDLDLSTDNLTNALLFIVRVGHGGSFNHWYHKNGLGNVVTLVATFHKISFDNHSRHEMFAIFLLPKNCPEAHTYMFVVLCTLTVKKLIDDTDSKPRRYLYIRVLLRNLLFREKMRRTDDPSDLFI